MVERLNTEEMLNLCKGAQHKRDVAGWKWLHQYDGITKNKQFNYTVYQKGNNIVLAFPGTELLPIQLNDLRNDRVLLSKDSKIPSQYGDAQILYNQVKKDYPKENIVTTGYSLGGTNANLLSHYAGIPSVAFAPIGSKHIAQANPDYFKYDDSNIKTFGVQNDRWFNSMLDEQSGSVHIMNNFGNDSIISDRFHRHMIDNYTPEMVKNAVKIKSTPKYPYTRDKNGLYPIVAGKIYTREDVDEMKKQPNVFMKNQDAILRQFTTMGLPYNSEAKAKVQSGELIYVQPYERADGTKVEGYYRRR